MQGSKGHKKRRRIWSKKIEVGCTICHPHLMRWWVDYRTGDMKRLESANDQLREALENQELAA